jgi:hypothetical protein
MGYGILLIKIRYLINVLPNWQLHLSIYSVILPTWKKNLHLSFIVPGAYNEKYKIKSYY